MTNYSLHDAPEGVQALAERARAGEISPGEFCQELRGLGVTGAAAMIYVRDACDLPLAEAKRIFIEQRYGSVDAWAEDVVRAIDEVAPDLEGSE